MAIIINSKFVKFNYVKYRTVEGQEGPQPYVREDIAEMLDAIVNYGAIAFISGYDNKLPWPSTNATINMPNPEILSGNVIFAQGKWFGTSKDSLEAALGDSKIIEKLQTELNIGHPAVGEPDQEGYEAPTGIFAEIDNQIKELKYFNRIGVPVEGTNNTYMMGAAKPGATLTIKGAGSTKVSADAETGTVTISSEAGETTTKDDIIIAGGPLANNVTESGDTWPTDWVDNAGNKIIPKDRSLEDILKALFLQEKYGKLSDPVYEWNPALSYKPSVDIKNDTTSVINTLVPVGTEVTVSFSIREGETNQPTATVSGATYGYSLDGTTIKEDSNYIANATGQGVTGTLTIESATFQGKDVRSQVAGTKYKVKEGDNTLSVTQSGRTATPGSFADATVYNVSNTKTINKADFKTINQDGFTSSTAYTESNKALSNSTSVKVTGYYPIYYGWLTDTSDIITSDYITDRFVDTLKSKLAKTTNANVPTTTTTEPGNSSFILALPVDLGYTSIVVKNATNEAPAGTPYYVDVVNVVEAKQYRVFYIANSTPTTGDATFKIELKK